MNSYLIFLLCHPHLSFLFIHCKIGKISGVVSERDYVCKIALLGKTSKETKVKGMSWVFLSSDKSDCAIYYYTCKLCTHNTISNIWYYYLHHTNKWNNKTKEISTKSANLITASPSETVSDCMAKMLLKDIRHLPLLDESGGVVGIVSIKDLVKAELKEKEDAIRTLSNFALGKGGHFGSD